MYNFNLFPDILNINPKVFQIFAVKIHSQVKYIRIKIFLTRIINYYFIK